MRAHVHFPVHTALSSERAGLLSCWWLYVYRASVRVPVGFRHNVGLAEKRGGVVFAGGSGLRSCGNVEVAVLGSPSLLSLMVSRVDVKQH